MSNFFPISCYIVVSCHSKTFCTVNYLQSAPVYSILTKEQSFTVKAPLSPPSGLLLFLRPLSNLLPFYS